MPELMYTLNAARDQEHNHQKFLAALKGINLDENQEDGQKKWEDMKARVASGGKVSNSNDITSLQGFTAKKAGFGIGRGMEYSSGNNIKNPFGK